MPHLRLSSSLDSSFTNVTPNLSDEEKEELAAFRKWVFSLTRDKLLRAMSFTFHDSAVVPDSSFGSSSQHAARRSHEYDLLVDMVRLQVPPPTPVHPRANGFKPASRWGPQIDDDYTILTEKLRKTQPRLFQWCRRRSSGASFSQQRSIRRGIQKQQRHHVKQDVFDVIARKKVTSWGEVLSLGCTREQQDADEDIVHGTYLKVDDKDSIEPVVACFQFRCDDRSGKEKKNDSEPILKMLHLASRGYFLSSLLVSPKKANTTLPYYTPWLNPAERWFSLSFYLASRFEVSLWESFHDSLHSQSSKSSPPERATTSSIMYKNSILEAALPKAFKNAIIYVMNEQQQRQLGELRDSILWNLLCKSNDGENKSLLMHHALLQQPQECKNSQDNWQLMLRSWSTTPLLQVNSSIGQWRVLLSPFIQQELAIEMENELLKESSKLTITKTDQQQQTTKKKKKKKRSKKRNRSRPVKLVPTVREEPKEQDGGSSSEQSNNEKGADELSGAQIKTPRFSYPTNETTPHERNRNVIFVLTILDDVVEDVFIKVGLGPTPRFDAASEESISSANYQTNRQEWNKTQTSNPSQRKLHQTTKSSQNTSSKLINNKVHPTIEKKSKNDHSQQGIKQDAKDMTKKSVRKDSHASLEIAKNSESLHSKSEHTESFSSTRNENQNIEKTILPLPLYNQNSTLRGTERSTPFYPGGWTEPSPQQWVVQPWTPNWCPPDNNSESQPSRHEAWGVPKAFGFPAYDAPPAGFYPPVGYSEFPIDDDGPDEWPFINRYQERKKSILTEFFLAQEERIDDDEKLMAASTAASIASSNYKDVVVAADTDDGEKSPPDEAVFSTGMNVIAEDDNNASADVSICLDDRPYQEDVITGHGSRHTDRSMNESSDVSLTNSPISDVELKSNEEIQSGHDDEIPEISPTQSPQNFPDCRSPSPQAPLTPPPTLSPILVSLADLRDLKKTSTPEQSARTINPQMTRPYSGATVSGSLPSSPVPSHKNGLTPSWSREDLRIASFRDDHNIKQRHQQPPEPLPSYRQVAIKSLAKPIASSKGTNVDFRYPTYDTVPGRKERREDSCAQSETAVEGHDDDQNWQSDIRKTQSPQAHEEVDNVTVNKDETTTITSTSQRESEEISAIREERNSFRDMCLTLGAEVAKLKAMLAAQKATAILPSLDYSDGFNYPMYSPGLSDPNGMRPFFHGMKRGQRIGAMSDAGLHRGDHESQVSEDEVYEAISKARVDNVRRMSSSATIAGSDTSVDYNCSSNALQGPVGTMPVYDAVSVQGLKSRLTKDILNFLNATGQQLRKQDGKRSMAAERFKDLVDTLWPRAQVKLYGSHVSGLCLPSSDLDVVICLPAVHKNAPALAPGVLEGRNAINETSQKLLARHLKGESWIDPRSIKLIERTVVPVIKVSTKDTRARVIQLDISFDSPEHHGLEAIEMVAEIMDELPMIRPLVLVLKQFLLDRGLLTSYTGGLSSYCLFLLVARYLQEQPLSCGDCGSLLIGFLDFYGNYFDARTTGVSVRRRQYFARPHNFVQRHQAAGQPYGGQFHQQHVASNPSVSGGHPDFLRRNSFSDSGNVDGVRSTPPSSMSRPPRFQPGRYVPHNLSHPNEQHNSFRHGRPFTFDPLFVEDPLSAGNNVGRNAFRIIQVQRAFSDAQRALVASLEWDIHSSGELNDGVEYPLLKCLLRSEDILHEL